MAHFYAFDHDYSSNIRDSRGLRIGSVAAFDSKRERDSYCYEEDAEPIDSKVARRQLLDEIGALDYCCEYEREDLRLMGMDELLEARDGLLARLDYEKMC